MLEEILKHHIPVAIPVQRAKHVPTHLLLKLLVLVVPVPGLRLEEKRFEVALREAFRVDLRDLLVNAHNTLDLVGHFSLPVPCLSR